MITTGKANEKQGKPIPQQNAENSLLVKMIPRIAQKFEAALLPYKSKYNELKYFPMRSAESPMEIEWKLHELSPKGQTKMSPVTDGIILLRVVHHSPSSRIATECIPCPPNRYCFNLHFGTNNLKLRKLVMESLYPSLMEPERSLLAIFQDILELKIHYPHFEGIQNAQFDGNSIGYENGREEGLNPHYAVERKKHEKELSKYRDASKQWVEMTAPAEPSKTITQWNKKNGIHFFLSFSTTPPALINPIFGVFKEPLREHEKLQLHEVHDAQRMGHEYEGKIRNGLYFSLQIEGGDQIPEISENIFQILEKYIH